MQSLPISIFNYNKVIYGIYGAIWLKYFENKIEVY